MSKYIDAKWQGIDMRAELCKTCIHTKVCFHDKNLVGDTFVCGFSDLDGAWEKFKELEKAGFPCDDYIPAADVQEVRHGEWVFKFYCGNMSGYDYGMRCSVCGKPMYRQFAEKMPPYCPNCGARMGAVEE